MNKQHMNILKLIIQHTRNTFAVLTLCTMQLSTISYANAEDLVTIDNAWVRNTLPGQEVSAAYMTLTSQQNIVLINVESNVTKSVEIHSMSMQNGVMKMRMLRELPITAGKPYALAPGGYHLMLFDLKKSLNVGDKVNFVLTFRAGAQELKQTVSMHVKSAADDDTHDDHKHHQHH